MPLFNPPESDDYLTATETDRKEKQAPPGHIPLDLDTSTETIMAEGGDRDRGQAEMERLIEENERLKEQLEAAGKEKEKAMRAQGLQQCLDGIRRQAKKHNLDSSLLTADGVLDAYGFNKNQQEGYTDSSSPCTSEEDEVILGREDKASLPEFIGETFTAYRTKATRKHVDRTLREQRRERRERRQPAEDQPQGGARRRRPQGDGDGARQARQEQDLIGTMASIFVNAMANFSTQKVEIPSFLGTKQQDPQAHLLAAKDWLDQSNVPLNRRSDKFRLTLKGKARVWYDSLDRDTKRDWPTLQVEFSKHYSLQGRTPKQLYDRWEALSFDPDMDDIDQFISEVKQTAKQLHLPPGAVITKIKGKMPQAMAWALTSAYTLDDVIKTVTEVFGRPHGVPITPRDPHAFSALQTSSGPSTTVQATQEKINSLETSIENLTAAIQRMGKVSLAPKTFKKPPYKPQGAENAGRGRGRGRGGYRNTGDRKPGGKPVEEKKSEKTSFSPRGRYDSSPTKKKPKVASKPVDRDSSRCNYCHNIGHWKKECPELKGNEGKSPTVRFDNLYDSGEEEEYEEFQGLQDEVCAEENLEFLESHQWGLN